MNNNMISIRKEDQVLMALVHYFVTKEDYSPILVQGVKDEIWLEKLNGPYRVIRINSNYIHNAEQINFDQYKVEDILRQIKKKTLSFNVNALNIYLNANEGINPKELKHIDSIELRELNDVKKNTVLNEIFPSLKDNLDTKTDNLELLFNVTKDINQKTARENKNFESLFAMKTPIITYAIMAICVVMFILEELLGGSEKTLVLFKLGAILKTAVVNGEYFRLITHAFLHIGIIHLICNMYVFYSIGPQIESHYGKWRFIVIYLLSTIGGGLLGCIFSPDAVSAGASGAIFGLLGALVYFGLKFRLYFKQSLYTQIIPIIIINLLIGFMIPNVGVAAHFGGLIYGYLAAMAVGIPKYGEKKDHINGCILMIIFTVFLGYLLFFR